MSVKRYDVNGSSSVFEDDNGSLVDYDGYVSLEVKLDESLRYGRQEDATIHNLELKITDMAVQIANSESKCRELAAENAGLNVFIEEECFVYSSDTTEPIDANDCKPETPATDAFLAEVRAQGVEDALKIMGGFTSDECGDSVYIAVKDLAAKLRQGGE